ncbi:hypothetical protein [Pontibacter actiniarum]|uniref:Uncharacterized protein n=1 Tax=Pontibacter actiniarum TaxID=323450 RepID=A0A1X9YQL5_9BACT|nr:hypothetical protein [Pontibacter actiniarum]ARS35131.1 hypothetical protein CA264_06560 [Pontibacter actiniarum]
MKKYLLLSVLWLVGFAGYAQGLRVTDEELDLVVLSMDLEGPEMANLEMKQELKLTEEQYSLVEQLNSSRYEQLQQAEETYALNPKQRTREVRNIHLRNDRDLQEVLSAEQLREYQKLEGRFTMRFVSENEE